MAEDERGPNWLSVGGSIAVIAGALIAGLWTASCTVLEQMDMTRSMIATVRSTNAAAIADLSQDARVQNEYREGLVDATRAIEARIDVLERRADRSGVYVRALVRAYCSVHTEPSTNICTLSAPVGDE